MATLTLKNIVGVALTIPDREFVVLTGPAGCGSSAIVRSIAGLEEVSEGDILFDDRRINDLAPKDRDVAFLSLDYTPYPAMTVYENLAIGLERRKFASAEIKKRTAAIAETLGLQDQLAASPKSLSAEQQRFVGLARAMVRQPKVYLFDEPFAKLDRSAASRGRAAIAELRQRSSATILYATSDPAEALALGERTVVIENRALRQDDAAQAIFDEPASLFVAKFFGDPPMNLVHGVLKQERDAVTFVTFAESGDGTIAVRLPISRFSNANELTGRPIVLGFRPEAVDIAVSPGAGNSSAAVFRAVVDRVEPRGSSTDVYVKTGAHEIVSRSRLWAGQAEGGHRFQFDIDLEKAHLFDAVSGDRVTPNA